MINKIEQIIISSLKELGDENDQEELLTSDENTGIYGTEGLLDSLSLVRLVGIIEEKIEEELNASISIASEKAMSQKNSPFLNVKSLSAFTNLLIKELENE